MRLKWKKNPVKVKSKYVANSKAWPGLLFCFQVQLYFPEADHVSYGVLRSVVKDSTDTYMGNSSVTYLDSDGQVGPVQDMSRYLSRFHVTLPCRVTMVLSRLLPSSTHWR